MLVLLFPSLSFSFLSFSLLEQIKYCSSTEESALSASYHHLFIATLRPSWPVSFLSLPHPIFLVFFLCLCRLPSVFFNPIQSPYSYASLRPKRPCHFFISFSFVVAFIFVKQQTKRSVLFWLSFVSFRFVFFSLFSTCRPFLSSFSYQSTLRFTSPTVLWFFILVLFMPTSFH